MHAASSPIDEPLLRPQLHRFDDNKTKPHLFLPLLSPYHPTKMNLLPILVTLTAIFTLTTADWVTASLLLNLKNSN